MECVPPSISNQNGEAGDWQYLLIDTSIDLRQQLLKIGAPPVGTVVYSHAHVDHFFGLDELRSVQYYLNRPIEIFCTPEVDIHLRTVYAHLFNPYVQQGGGILSVKVFPTQPRFRAGAFELVTLPVLHGSQQVQGYRWGSLAFITDCSHIPDATWHLMEGVEILVLDALRKTPHETHFNIAQALKVVERVKPRQTWFIHMTHDLLHDETNAELPEGVALAYDGLELELPGFDPLGWEL
jgi:phosphoribosyl 1,2-cyclic phosphate phosphodiesterase